MTEPRAHHYRISVCEDPNCTAVHISLFDKDDKIFAGMTLKSDDASLAKFIINLCKAADLAQQKMEPSE